jgi:hypothetical protein
MARAPLVLSFALALFTTALTSGAPPAHAQWSCAVGDAGCAMARSRAEWWSTPIPVGPNHGATPAAGRDAPAAPAILWKPDAAAVASVRASLEQGQLIVDAHRATVEKERGYHVAACDVSALYTLARLAERTVDETQLWGLVGAMEYYARMIACARKGLASPVDPVPYAIERLSTLEAVVTLHARASPAFAKALAHTIPTWWEDLVANTPSDVARTLVAEDRARAALDAVRPARPLDLAATWGRGPSRWYTALSMAAELARKGDGRACQVLHEQVLRGPANGAGSVVGGNANELRTELIDALEVGALRKAAPCARLLGALRPDARTPKRVKPASPPAWLVREASRARALLEQRATRGDGLLLAGRVAETDPAVGCPTLRHALAPWKYASAKPFEAIALERVIATLRCPEPAATSADRIPTQLPPAAPDRWSPSREAAANQLGFYASLATSPEQLAGFLSLGVHKVLDLALPGVAGGDGADCEAVVAIAGWPRGAWTPITPTARRALEALHAGAEHGTLSCMTAFGIFLIDGLGGPVERDRGVPWLCAASTFGSAKAGWVLADHGLSCPARPPP